MSNAENKKKLLINEEASTSEANKNTYDSINKNDNTNNNKNGEGEDENENVELKQYEGITAKEAYFLSLNQWAKRANIAHNTMAQFPWYLMTTYPEILQQPQQARQATAFATLSATLWGLVPPPAQQTQSPQSLQSEQPFQQRTSATNSHQISSNNNNYNNGEGVATISELSNQSNRNDNQDIPLVVARLLNRSNDDSFGRRRFRILSEQTQTDLINITGGYEYTIAPFWKRLAAEFIDTLILLCLKILLMILIVVIYDFEFDFIFDMDKETMVERILKPNEYYTLISIFDVLSVSRSFLFIEIIIKILVCFYEAACITWLNGATPGKAIMGLSIKYVEAIQVLQVPQQLPFPQYPIQLAWRQAHIELPAILYPAETPTFLRVLLRAFIKTVLISMLFPVFLVMSIFKNNRLAYDVMTKTVVVIQPKESPPFRRGVR